MSDFFASLQRALDRDQGGDPWGHLPGGTMPVPELCTALMHPGFHGNMSRPPEPPEFCDEDAVDGEDYCERHLHLSDSWEEF